MICQRPTARSRGPNRERPRRAARMAAPRDAESLSLPGLHCPRRLNDPRVNRTVTVTETGP